MDVKQEVNKICAKYRKLNLERKSLSDELQILASYKRDLLAIKPFKLGSDIVAENLFTSQISKTLSDGKRLILSSSELTHFTNKDIKQSPEALTKLVLEHRKAPQKLAESRQTSKTLSRER